MRVRIKLKEYAPGEPIPGLCWHDGNGGLYQAIIEENLPTGWVPVEIVREDDETKR